MCVVVSAVAAVSSSSSVLCLRLRTVSRKDQRVAHVYFVVGRTKTRQFWKTFIKSVFLFEQIRLLDPFAFTVRVFVLFCWVTSRIV